MAVRPAILKAAGAILGRALDADDQVQDASFFGELFLFEEGPISSRVTARVFKLAIRFSCFGRMATIYTNSVISTLDGYPVDQLEGLLQAHGFRFVPAAALAEPYDGRLPDTPSDFTWWDRFFDYM